MIGDDDEGHRLVIGGIVTDEPKRRTSQGMSNTSEYR